MMSHSRSSVVFRLGAAAFFFAGLLGAAPSPASSSTPTLSHVTAVSASSAGGSSAGVTLTEAVEQALEEAKKATAILKLTELHGDPAFSNYSETIESAVDRYLNTSGQESTDIFAFAMTLQMARASLIDRVESPSGWVAVWRALNPGYENRYVVIPERFVGPPVSIAYEEPPTAEEIESWFELDEYEA